jgi:hypothetical protein
VTVWAAGLAPASFTQISATPPVALASPASRVHVPDTESVTVPSDDATPRPLPIEQYATSSVLAAGVNDAVVIVAVFAVAYAVEPSSRIGHVEATTSVGCRTNDLPNRATGHHQPARTIDCGGPERTGCLTDGPSHVTDDTAASSTQMVLLASYGPSPCSPNR